MKKILSAIFAIVLFLANLTGCGKDFGTVNMNVGTSATRGTYYTYTNVVATILHQETKIGFNVVSTGGSVSNINGIDDGDYNMALVQNDTMINAYNNLDSANFSRAITSFSVIGGVHTEVVQIVVRGDLKDKVKTLADLKGMRVSVGDAGSGVYLNAKDLLAAYGLDIDKDIQQNNLSVGNSADAMRDGKLDAFFITAGPPTTAVTELGTAMDVFMLSLDEKVMKDFIANHKIDGKYEVYSIQPITHDQYDFIPENQPAYTIGVTATYIVAKDVDEDVVYKITKALWEKKDDIAMAHAVGKGMDINNAIAAIGNVPVHPGAERYYKEIGIIK